VPTHIYVWGPKGADWMRTGWWQIRFEDRFDPVGGVRESVRTRPPWSDENAAADGIGARHRSGYWRWTASIDPSGRAALVSACISGTRCVPYAVADGRPILALREAPGTTGIGFKKPMDHGLARLGDTWYFLTEVVGAEFTLWRAELGVMRELGHYLRFNGPRFQGAAGVPLLVRRALGAEIGLLIKVPADPSRGLDVGEWVVLPIDANNGALGEPVILGNTDLEGKVPPRCSEHDDGWIVDTALPVSPNVQLTGVDGFVDEVELRLRIDPGFACAEAIAARAGRGFKVSEKSKGATDSESIPMAVRERYSGKRWQLSCRPAPAGTPRKPAAPVEPEEEDEDDE
jgi:hypothetical protein